MMGKRDHYCIISMQTIAVATSFARWQYILRSSRGQCITENIYWSNDMRLLISWSSWRWPALVSDLSARPPEVTLWCHLLVLRPDRKDLSRLWFPTFGIVSPLTSVLCGGTFRVLFIHSSRLCSLTEPGCERL